MSPARAGLRITVSGITGAILGIPLVLWLQPPPLAAVVLGSSAVTAGLVAGAATL